MNECVGSKKGKNKIRIKQKRKNPLNINRLRRDIHVKKKVL